MHATWQLFQEIGSNLRPCSSAAAAIRGYVDYNSPSHTATLISIILLCSFRSSASVYIVEPLALVCRPHIGAESTALRRERCEYLRWISTRSVTRLIELTVFCCWRNGHGDRAVRAFARGMSQLHDDIA